MNELWEDMDKKSNFACISVMSIDILDLIIAAQQKSFALRAYILLSCITLEKMNDNERKKYGSFSTI